MRFDPHVNGGQWYHDLLALSGYLAQGPLERALSHLVEVRVSVTR